MIEQDTVRLLRECDAGVKMGIASLEDVLDGVRDPKLKAHLAHCRQEHLHLEQELQRLLGKYGDSGKDPGPIAKGMSRMKTNMKMSMDHSDRTVAGLITDGCNMGVKSLNQYLNQYRAADEVSKDITKRLIHQEEHLTQQLRDYL